MDEDRKVIIVKILIIVRPNRACKIFEKWPANKVLTAKINRDFALAREIIYDHENEYFFKFFT